MKNLHHHLSARYHFYRKWHEHPYHQHHHWLVAILALLIGSYAIAGAWQVTLVEQELWVSSTATVQAQSSGRILVLVNSEALRTSISSSLATYQADLVSEGYSVEILTGPWSTPQAVRSLLQSRRAGLTGAVLVGNIPALKFNDEPSRQGDPYWYDYPSDMYYMDLDGTWSDGDSNGTYETWDGSLPEIWVSRLKADNLGLLGDEVSILRSYFNKNHQFRTGSLSVPRRALVVYHNIDIVRSQAEHNGWGTSPSLLYGDVTIDGPSIENLSEDPNSDVVRHARQRWIDALRDQNGYELMALNTATFATKHTFGTPPNESGGNNVTSADIDALSPKRAIWFHFLTSNPGYYLAENYIGGIYLFDSPTALVAYAGTQHSGVAGYKPLYEALAQNKTFGATLKDSAAYELSNLGKTYTEYVAWTPDHRDTWDLSKKIAATVLLGDGTLRLKTTPSSPPPCSTATLDFSGTSVGTTKSCTVDLNLSGASSATLSYTAEDIDEAGEATWRVNASQSQNVPATGDAQVRQFSVQVPLSSLTSGTNTVSFTFASNLGGTTSGFRITNIRLTAGTGTPGITVGRWEMGELALTAGNSYANPFRDVSVSATFISPSGKNLAIPGFYDGNNTWKIRYTLDEVGAWQWQTVSQDSSLMKSGVVTVVNSSKKGFIRAHKADPHHFQYSNGESFFYMGDTSYNLVTLDRGSQRLPYLQRRSSQGFSHLRFIIGNDTAQGWPWGGTPASPDRARLNLSYFQKVDQTMEDLATNGMGAEIIMLNYYDAGAFAWSRSQEDFFLSYLLARYGAFTNLVQWTLVNEHELYPDGSYGTITSEDIAWIRDRAAFIRARDPFKHFLTTHPDTSDAQMGTLFGSDSNLTIIQHQTNGSDKQRVNNCYYRWEGEGLEDFVAGDRSYNKPVVVGEFGYEYNGSTCQGVNSDTDTLRKSAWRFRMGGAYFSAGFRSTVYNFSGITFDVDNNGGKAQWQMQYLADIFKSLPYTEMSPSFQLANSLNLALAKSNEAYLVYSPQGGTVSLNLSSASGSFAVTWHNPRTGASQGLSTVSGGATRTFNAPDNQDWALVVQKGSGSQQSQACSVATLDFSGTSVGTTKSCTVDLNLSGASSATLSYTAEDIDEAGEATWRVNASQSQNVPATGDAQVRQFSVQVPLSSLTSGTNTVSFTFASNLGGTTSGFRITNVSLTVSTTAPDTTPPTISTFDVQPRQGTGSFTLSWSVSDSGSGVASIEPWWSGTSCAGASDETWKQLDTLSDSAISYPHTGAINGPNCYGLHVKDQAGNLTTEAQAGKGPIEVVKSTGGPLDSVSLYGVYEQSFTASSGYTYTNAPAMTVTFTGTSGTAMGETATVRGFWDGGSVFRVRFSPSKAGAWRWATSSADAGLNGTSGIFTVSGALPSTHSSSRGHVIVDSTTNRTFKHRDGAPYFLMGDTQWAFPSAAIAWPGEFQTWVNARQQQHFNYAHTVIYNTWPSSDAERNEGGHIFLNSDLNQLNPGYFRSLDDRITYLNEHGFAVGMVFAWANQGWQNFQSAQQVNRFAQYLIDRYGAYNVFWILAGEYEEAGIPGGWNALGNYVKDHDPYQHPRTTHTVNTSADDFGHEAWHTVTYHQTANFAINLSQVTIDRETYHKPVINSEFEYEGDISADEVRRRAWEIVMRGGFPVYGNTTTYHYDASMTSAHLNSPGARAMTNLYNFFNENGYRQVWWQNFSRFEELGNNRFLAGVPGQQYVYYTQYQGSQTLHLSDASGALTVRCYDPLNGSWKGNEVTVNAGPSVSLTTSGEEACLITASTPDTISPTVNNLVATSTPRPAITWSVADSGGSGLSFVQVWRANRGSYSSCSLVPGADFQQMPQGNPQNLNPGTGGTGSWQEPSNLATGTYCYGLHVNDQAGNYSAESPAQRPQVVVTTSPSDTTPPTVSLTAPAANTTVSGTVTVSATASDNVGVTRVEFVVDGTIKSTDTASPYSFSWDTTNGSAHPCNGPHTHTLSARASDAANNQGASANVTVNMNNPVYCGSSVCGLNGCEAGETPQSCPADCTPSGTLLIGQRSFERFGAGETRTIDCGSRALPTAGSYTIYGSASTAQGETNTANNTRNETMNVRP